MNFGRFLDISTLDYQIDFWYSDGVTIDFSNTLLEFCVTFGKIHTKIYTKHRHALTHNLLFTTQNSPFLSQIDDPIAQNSSQFGSFAPFSFRSSFEQVWVFQFLIFFFSHCFYYWWKIKPWILCHIFIIFFFASSRVSFIKCIYSIWPTDLKSACKWSACNLTLSINLIVARIPNVCNKSTCDISTLEFSLCNTQIESANDSNENVLITPKKTNREREREEKTTLMISFQLK